VASLRAVSTRLTVNDFTALASGKLQEWRKKFWARDWLFLCAGIGERIARISGKLAIIRRFLHFV
jgi:hypothetical protein